MKMKSIFAVVATVMAVGLLYTGCGGGGGVSANARAEPLRLQAFKVKQRQIEATGTQTLITACANCRIVMEEGLEHYHMKVEVIGLTELLAQYLVEDNAT